MKGVMEVIEGRTKSRPDAPISFVGSVSAHSAGSVHTERTEPFVDALEAAHFLKLHPKTLLRLARRKAIPAHPLTGRRRHIWRFLLSELDAWARGRG